MKELKKKSISGLNTSEVSFEKKGFGKSGGNSPDISLENKSMSTSSKTVNQPSGFES